MIRMPHLVLILSCAAVGAHAADPAPALGVPLRLELFLDGARLFHEVAVTAGRSRIDLPADAGEVVQVDGADGWLIESRIDSATPPPEPQLLRELVEASAALDRRGAVVAAEEDAAARIGAE
ncbi:MAG: hypothetical protein H0W72_16615, partial [Planctomycetes bacterium]|nr:hypothetical protein [Planctomycetota bacterium]